MRVLVTGASGFIGRRLVDRLLREGAEVWAGVRSQTGHERLRPGERSVYCDLRDGSAVEEAVRRSWPHLVYHLAAVGVTAPRVDPLEAVQVNVAGTVRLLESLRRVGCQRVVLTGTCYEYGAREAMEGLDPFNIYAASKVAAWAFARAYWRAFDLPVVVARLFQVYGPGQPEHTLIPSAIRAALLGQDFPMTQGEQQRDFIYVDDVVDCLLVLGRRSGLEGESLDVGTGQACSVYEVVDRLWRMVGARSRVLAGALPYRPGEVMHLVADADRTARLAGWRAQVALEAGLRRTVEAMANAISVEARDADG